MSVNISRPHPLKDTLKRQLRKISALRVSKAATAMPEMSLPITRRRFAPSLESHIALVAAMPLSFFRPELAQPVADFSMTVVTTRVRKIVLGLVLAAACTLPTAAQEQRGGFYTPPAADAIHPVVAEHGMVVAQEKIAARVGADVLRRGGNAVDAAVATGFAMAVTYPRAGNIGGGGFMVIHSKERGEDVTIDYRETAPAATTPEIFLGTDGKPDIAKSRDSALGIGVPGTVAGLTLALEKYGSGKFTLAELLKPAIALARDGFVVTDDVADTMPEERAAAGALAVGDQDIFRQGRHALARWRPAGSGRSGDDAVGDCRTGTARVLPGPGRRKTGEGDRRRRRHHDAGRSQILFCRRSARRCAAAIAVLTSSRCRCRRPAASCSWKPSISWRVFRWVR